MSAPKHKFKALVALAYAIDSFRIFPRVFISVYIYLLYESVTWFMSLPEPTTQQASLISVMTGIGAAWFGLYTQTKPESKKEDSTRAFLMGDNNE